MASNALEEKINKIRQQNEEIRRRYEEVEEDKKNAAKLNALVQMVPSTDWPERKEPPEFVNPPKIKPKSTKEKHEYISHSHAGEGKKIHSFAQGEGPPPDPKYNFLADSEREEPSVEYIKENNGNRSHHKVTKGSFRKKINSRESNQKDIKSNKGNYRDESQPAYDAWRAERNRIDEDRISRQRTAEGNWRREWDNDKVHIIYDAVKKSSRPTLGEFTKKDKDSDKRYHVNNNEHVNYIRGTHRPHRGTKNFYNNYENRSYNTYDQHRNNTAISTKTPVSPTSEERTVIATDKSIKVTVNQSNITKGPVMSVKVNSPSIAGTGRVGPRQRTRLTYSHSDVDTPSSESESFFRQKSFEDKSKGTYFNNQKFPNLKRSHSQRKKENETKYQYHSKKDIKKEDSDSYKHYENEFKSYTQKDQYKSHVIKSSKSLKENIKMTENDSSNMNISQTHETQECSTPSKIKLEQNVEMNIEHNIELNIKHNDEQNIEHNSEKKIKCNDEQNIEHNATENCCNIQSIKVSNIENVQSNIENKITNKISSIKDIKIEEISLSSILNTDNFEHITKDDIDKNNFENNNECLDSLTNNVTKDLRENMSSEISVPINIQCNEKLILENNEIFNDVIEIDKDLLYKDDQQKSKQVMKQFVNDCDNIENKVTVQESIEEITDNSVSLLKDKIHSVIEINNQSVCNNKLIEKEQLIQKEILNLENTAKKNNVSDNNLKDTMNFCETKSENIFNPADGNVDGNSVQESKDKIEEIKENKEKVNEINDKILQ
ncbi:asparagine-rich protein [Apis mellifera]|uniref:Asparagine-rich protein n=1 Tax=Apis mellifera TaxID=7460 RepID=A0A7M7RDH4_APIME|nr:asparagine-rich protein [Apis mellifera]|eukprot:XP_625001.2 asparagine-rich protein [Apis mellifera]